MRGPPRVARVCPLHERVTQRRATLPCHTGQGPSASHVPPPVLWPHGPPEPQARAQHSTWGRRAGRGRRSASPAFGGCISGLGDRRRQERLDALPKVSQLGRGALVLGPLGSLQHRLDIRWRKPEWLLGQGKRRQGRSRRRRD